MRGGEEVRVLDGRVVVVEIVRVALVVDGGKDHRREVQNQGGAVVHQIGEMIRIAKKKKEAHPRHQESERETPSKCVQKKKWILFLANKNRK